ncbi:hypothetical protein ACWA1C_09155 [Flectobacillus roseus]
MEKYQLAVQEFAQKLQSSATIEGEFYDETAIEVINNLGNLFAKSPNVLVTFSNKELTEFIGEYASRNDVFFEDGSYNFKSVINHIGEKTGKDLSFLAPIIEKMGKGEKVGFSDLMSLQGLFSL